MRFLMLSLLLSLSVRAEDTFPINKGEASPVDGIVMTTDKARSLKNELLDKDMLVKQVGIYKLNEELLNNQVALWRTQSDSLSKQLTDEKYSFWSNTGFFLLGVAVTTGLAYGVSRATR